MTEAIIRCEEVDKHYQIGTESIHALSGVSVTIERGEFVSVMGPSGSGKSTFMNVMGCLDTPDRGTIFVDREEVSGLSSNELAEIRNRKVGFVFQQFNLLARTSAWENVALPLLYSGMDKNTRRNLAVEALEKVGLGDRITNHPTQLSGGQQQRVAIARAIVNNPSIVLADEPTGALDSHTGQEILDLFVELNQNDITIVVVTHELEVAYYARRILRFRDGEVVDDERFPESQLQRRLA